MSAQTIRRPLRLALTPALLASVLALSACGGGDDSTTNAGAAGGSGTTSEQRSGARGDMTKLQACLKEQGVELPGRPSGQDGERPEGAPEGMPEGAAPPEGGGPPEGGLPGGGAPPTGENGEGRRGGFGNLSDEDREKLQKAMEKCGGQAPGANRRGGPAGARQRPDVNSAAYRKTINAYVTCVRKNGYDLPDPDFSGDGPIFDPKEVDQQDATFKKASKACQSTLQTPRSGGGSTTTTTPSGA